MKTKSYIRQRMMAEIRFSRIDSGEGLQVLIEGTARHFEVQPEVVIEQVNHLIRDRHVELVWEDGAVVLAVPSSLLILMQGGGHKRQPARQAAVEVA